VVDEYDQSDEGQSISIAGVPNGTYWLRAIVDPDNYLAESNKANNETDVELTIHGNIVQVLQTVTPVLLSPPSISVNSPARGSTVSGVVQFDCKHRGHQRRAIPHRRLAVGKLGFLLSVYPGVGYDHRNEREPLARSSNRWSDGSDRYLGSSGGNGFKFE